MFGSKLCHLETMNRSAAGRPITRPPVFVCNRLRKGVCSGLHVLRRLFSAQSRSASPANRELAHDRPSAQQNTGQFEKRLALEIDTMPCGVSLMLARAHWASRARKAA
jgi:hypothetical protein